MPKPGNLYIVSTPIGNLEDITLRALRILREADLIAAEDTRHTRKLLAHFDIHVPLCAYYQHNRLHQGKKLIDKLMHGTNIALVSDAGTPGISDPGALLVEEALRAGIEPVIIPGACAAIAVLAVSGLPTARFHFEGYLAHRSTTRKKRLEELKEEDKTLIFYLSPHRLKAELADIIEVMGNRPAALAREVTKKYEEFIREPLSDILAQVEKDKVRGEYALVLAGQPPQVAAEKTDAELAQLLNELIQKQAMSKKEAVASLAKKLNLPKKRIYKIGVDLCQP